MSDAAPSGPAVSAARPASGVAFAELHARTAFSFLEGASPPEEMAETAAGLGLRACAVTDRDGLYGVVRFAEAARSVGLDTVFGAELTIGDSGLVVLARGPEGYRRLSREISRAHMRCGTKGAPDHELGELADAAGGHWRILADIAWIDRLPHLVALFGGDHVTARLSHRGLPTDDEDHDRLAGAASAVGIGTVASASADFASPRRRRLASAMAAVRHRASLDLHDAHLHPAGGMHLRSGDEMARIFHRYPDAVAESVRIADECAFDLALVAPGLPPWDVPEGHTEASWLRALTLRGFERRYGGTPHEERARVQIDHELRVIRELGFPGYFLIVHDIVDFCRRNDILCQGRGSAANSAVCYALGITAVDAVANGLLFERFLAPERDGPPDIDVDIESGRREEVIQYVYGRYGREHAAQVANVITYRGRSAVRDMARALGFSQGQQDAWSRRVDRWSGPGRGGREVAEGGIPAEVLDLAEQIRGYPRHLGIHSGGMVICDRPVADVVPVEWARMPGRSVLQWDKDDAAAAGLVKFDLLGLGMLSALHHAIDLAREHKGIDVDLARLDLGEEAVYDMLCRADAVGVFQVESRAQMATLPRLRPRCFYDLVVEVALIRPGPIQGGSVHPFIRRRNGREPVVYDHPALRPALERTLGVPLFQEQLMQIAKDVAGFTGAEADMLRRAMGAKRSTERMLRLRDRFFAGMRELHGIGVDPGDDVGERIWEKMVAFADYGFPESHSQSFAGIVFQSAWFKLHHPAIFCAALLRAQPMGFYSPQSLVADARRHGVRVHRPCVNASRVDADCENAGTEVRLGLAGVRDVGAEAAERIVTARRDRGPYTSVHDLARRAGLHKRHLEALATAGAMDCLGLSRREALWAAGAAAGETPAHLPGLTEVEAPTLPGMDALEETVADVWATGVSPDRYPTVFARPVLSARGVLEAVRLAEVPDGTRVRVAGVVTHRQRPSTAEGVTFLNLEDETGMANVICSVGLWAHHRSVATSSPAMVVRGIVENASGAVNVIADRLERLHLGVASRSRDFR